MQQNKKPRKNLNIHGKYYLVNAGASSGCHPATIKGGNHRGYVETEKCLWYATVKKADYKML